MFFTLVVFHLNICHICNKLDELKNTVFSNSPLIDVCGFTETFLSNDIDDSFLNIESYNLFRRDRPLRVGGGIIVYIHKKWNVKRRIDLECV